VADKPESQDFVAGGDYAPLFADRPPEPGDFVDVTGKVIGRHRGLPYYTIGQRRGLGLSLAPEPLYVLRLEADTNRVVLGDGTGLFAETVEVRDFRLQDPRMAAIPGGLVAFAKIRQNHRPAPCLVHAGGGGEAVVGFETAQRAVAPGQSLVLYDGEGLVLGGGIIEGAAS
jgi:tRNA-uridine 2-sulfurtransferase